jgi:two-component system sensor histidine kinase UhpB
MELPRLVMRRAAVAALACLAIALVLGLARVRLDTQQEMSGSLAVARASAALALLHSGEATPALESLGELGGLRHLQLDLLDANGERLLHLPDTATQAGAQHLRWLGVMPPSQSVSWPVQRPDGRSWTVVLTSSPDSEVQEALSNLAGLFVLLALCSLLMLAVMHWNTRRAFRPLQVLVGAIERARQRDLAGLQALPTMPIGELEAIAQALRQLAAELEHNEAARRVLGHRLLSLQEDERQQLARDLHDEFGQRLTALRVDAAWLQRRLDAAPQQQSVVAGMGQQIERVQDDVRRLLQRLRPLGPVDDAAPATLGRLRLMLEELRRGWSAAPGCSTQFEVVACGDESVPLPPALVLGIYRISQEGFTNVARHAQARVAQLRVELTGHGEERVLHWSLLDDGRGVAGMEAALRRGGGLAGLKERIWALGGEFSWGDAGGAGLALRARLPLTATLQEAVA